MHDCIDAWLHERVGRGEQSAERWVQEIGIRRKGKNDHRPRTAKRKNIILNVEFCHE
jgi:hypothetical protein